MALKPNLLITLSLILAVNSYAFSQDIEIGLTSQLGGYTKGEFSTYGINNTLNRYESNTESFIGGVTGLLHSTNQKFYVLKLIYQNYNYHSSFTSDSSSGNYSVILDDQFTRGIEAGFGIGKLLEREKLRFRVGVEISFYGAFANKGFYSKAEYVNSILRDSLVIHTSNLLGEITRLAIFYSIEYNIFGDVFLGTELGTGVQHTVSIGTIRQTFE